MSGIGEDDAKRESKELIGVLSSFSFCFACRSCLFKSATFLGGGYRSIALVLSFFLCGDMFAFLWTYFRCRWCADEIPIDCEILECWGFFVAKPSVVAGPYALNGLFQECGSLALKYTESLP